MSHFDPTSISRFRFVRRAFDAASGRVELAYAFDNGAEMVETLVIPGAPFALDAARQSAVEEAVEAAGASRGRSTAGRPGQRGGKRRRG